VGMRVLSIIIGPALLCGCWKLETAAIPPNVLEFEPASGEGPEDWVVRTLPVPLECPDDQDTSFYIVYPRKEPETPMPAVVIYHSGSFDFVFAPSAEDPLAGTHFAEPGRLESAWAVRQVFTTLGMYPSTDPTETHTGLLAARLASAGFVVMLPANCWGDTWHNVRGRADNDFPSDFFSRDGRAAAEWGYRFLIDDFLADAFDVTVPVPIDKDAVYLIGLGEGGRAVSELLEVDNNEDGVPDLTPAGVVIDSAADDLRVYFDDPSLYGNTIAGLNRIFLGGRDDVDVGSLYHAPLPERVAYLYSDSDPAIPLAAHTATTDRLYRDGGWLYVDDAQGHILSNGANPELTDDLVHFLLTGEHGTPGPGTPASDL
jgi:hypothetical protein